MGNQAYKLKLPKKWRIYDVFHISLLKQDTIRKGQVNKVTSTLKFANRRVGNKDNTGSGGGKKYEVEAICKSTI